MGESRMGKVVKLRKAKDRATKKYNPYKLNPLTNKLESAVRGSGLESAIVTDEKGDIKLDDAGKPVFRDVIEWETTGGQIMAIWTCIKELLDQRLVPPNEQDAAFDLLTLMATLHRNSTKTYKASLPINYFVGTWHVLNTCRKFDLFKEDKPLSASIDELTLWFAERIDIYHVVKKGEKVEEKGVSVDDVLSPPKASNSDEEDTAPKLYLK